MSFTVIDPGMLTLLQDYGRFGHQSSGYTQGGPMDEHAFLWANRLLHNPINTPQLEITIGQLVLEATSPTIIALTGADMQAKINDTPIPCWQTAELKTGDRLSFGFARDGLRTYLAVKGGFQITPVLDSVATVCREKIGGLTQAGSRIKAGDSLPYTSYQRNKQKPQRQVPAKYQPDYSAPLELRVIEGYQRDLFPESAVEQFYNSAYTISQNSDRMGFRLEGPALQGGPDGVVSEGIAYGAIQIPSDGQPIILMKDRQTIGGYPKLGCIAAMDAFRLSQCRPGTAVTFIKGDIDTIRQERLAMLQFFGINH
ncbi:biotin-dependent carboxyltransferase family protein [Parendozoicomonas haliclonae]|uniref:KipI antagonist n=1 Tax=Parendozoicomonas haliclonae TaxID=1960125 RepID=A0A1X7AHM2_9GAMM|nr:biotin-dependent carboxyltransferase family protein [Parendozoicomonas haliclonae]SMA42034.1 KipI antagonist [Parendozoicomonas haliclonae]